VNVRIRNFDKHSTFRSQASYRETMELLLRAPFLGRFLSNACKSLHSCRCTYTRNNLEAKQTLRTQTAHRSAPDKGANLSAHRMSYATSLLDGNS